MPLSREKPRRARMDLRLSAEHKRVIEQAAAASGQSVSDFAVSTLVGAATRALENSTLTRLSNRDRDLFLRLLDSRAKPTATLAREVKRYLKSRG